MNVPEDSQAQFEAIQRECRTMIDRGLWDIKASRFESWSKQFVTDEEVFFASCILEKLVYRNAHQFEAGLKSIFRSNLNNAFQPASNDLTLLEILRTGNRSRKIRIVPVIKNSDPPTKSGPLVLRRLKKSLRIKDNLMIWPWQIKKLLDNGEIEKVIFLDDFLGSGNQFEEFLSQWGVSATNSTLELFYVTVVAHEDGLRKLNERYPTIKVVYAETLSKRNHFFDEANWQKLGQGLVTADNAKDWYINFAKRNGITPNNVGVMGVEDMALSFGFSHSTPNNSLPILWYENYRTGWKPLLER